MDLVEMKYELIYKADEKKRNKKPGKEYRASHLKEFNPRSDTYVKEGLGSYGRRLGGPMVAGTAGEIAGRALARGNPAGGHVGRGLGTSATLTRNVRSGDTVSYHKKTGKKAKAKVDTPLGIYNIY